MPDISSYDPLVQTLITALCPALQRWGRSRSSDYSAFDSIVMLELACVEDQAEALAAAAPRPRAVTDADRQKAVWYLISGAITLLRPPPEALPAAVAGALAGLLQARWPGGMAVPQQCHDYLVFYLTYVTKSHSNQALADLLQVSEHNVGAIHNAALATIAERLAAWEQQLGHDEAMVMTLGAVRSNVRSPHW